MANQGKQSRWRERSGFLHRDWTKGYQSGYNAGRNNRLPKQNFEEYSTEYQSAYWQGWNSGLDKFIEAGMRTIDHPSQVEWRQGYDDGRYKGSPDPLQKEQLRYMEGFNTGIKRYGMRVYG